MQLRRPTLSNILQVFNNEWGVSAICRKGTCPHSLPLLSGLATVSLVWCITAVNVIKEMLAMDSRQDSSCKMELRVRASQWCIIHRQHVVLMFKIKILQVHDSLLFSFHQPFLKSKKTKKKQNLAITGSWCPSCWRSLTFKVRTYGGEKKSMIFYSAGRTNEVRPYAECLIFVRWRPNWFEGALSIFSGRYYHQKRKVFYS